MNNRSFLLIFLAFLVVGCGQELAGSSAANDAQIASFEAVYAAAEEALAAAEDRRNVWSKTEELLSDAKSAFISGDLDSAIDLATEAKLQAELALAQADSEEGAWRSRVLSE
jgi:hypothetical protein